LTGCPEPNIIDNEMARAVLLVSFVLALSGCKERPEPPDVTVERPTSGPQHAGKEPVAKDPKFRTKQLSRALANKSLAPVDIAAASALLPTDFGGAVVAPLAPIGQGRQAQQSVCYAKLEPAAATAKLTATLKAAGWKDVQSREHRRASGRFSLSANKAEHRMAASIQPSKPGDESKCDGGATAVLTMHHLVDRAAAQPLQPGSKGTIQRPSSAPLDTTASPR
jgi:hypothetical protein